MVPPIDTSRARKCMKCGTVKEPAEFKTARKCIACVAASTAADDEAYRVANLPVGTIMTAEDILAAPWTITELKVKNKIKQGFVKLMDLGPDFLNGVVPATTDAKITDAASRTAHKQTSKESISFCSVPWCLKHLGLKQCSKCPPENNVRSLKDFNPRDGDGPRGECKDCQSDDGAARRAECKKAAAASGSQQECVTCHENKPISSFDPGRSTCNSCRNAAAKERGKAKAVESPDKFRMCLGCGTAHPIANFDQGNTTCRKRLAVGAKSDARPERKAYSREFNKKQYYKEWRAKKRAEDEAGFLKHQAETHRAYYAANSAKIMAWQKTNARAQLKSIKSGAMGRGYAWDLEDDFALGLIASPCFYSGIYELDIHTMGIDRVDSSKGYIEANCVPCDGCVNMMKGDMDVHDFVEECAKVADGDSEGGLMLSHYKACITRGMKCKFEFVDLCKAIVNNFDPEKLPC